MIINIRKIKENDPSIISEAFRMQGWIKPVELYKRYVEEQKNGERVSLIAEVDGEFAGYVNVVWNSYYPPFREKSIPEINDFNVLIKYRRQGIGSKLLDFAEEIIKERSEYAGIGVGLFSDYGHAQILYVKRGYVPDGRGISKNERFIEWGESVVVDDDVALHLIKRLM